MLSGQRLGGGRGFTARLFCAHTHKRIQARIQALNLPQVRVH
jgi:hypothetical protein